MLYSKSLLLFAACLFFSWYRSSKVNILRESDIRAFALACCVVCLLITGNAALRFNNVYKYLLYGHKEGGRNESQPKRLESRTSSCYGTQIGLSSFFPFSVN